VLNGARGNDRLDGGPEDDTLYGGAGADRFDINPNFKGTDTFTDVTLSDGDRLRVNTDGVNKSSWDAAGLAVLDKEADAYIVSASDHDRIYAKLIDVDHQLLIDNFSTYVELY